MSHPNAKYNPILSLLYYFLSMMKGFGDHIVSIIIIYPKNYFLYGIPTREGDTYDILKVFIRIYFLLT